jgi:hypothetical protein
MVCTAAMSSSGRARLAHARSSSSAISTRVTAGGLRREDGRARKRCRGCARLRGAAEQRRALAHADPAVPSVCPRGALARRGVADRELKCRLAEGKLDPRRASAVTGGVGKRLLQDSVSGQVDGGLERLRLPRPGNADVSQFIAGVARTSSQAPAFTDKR